MTDNAVTFTQLTRQDIQGLMFRALEDFFERKGLAPIPADADADDIIDIDEAAQIIGKHKTTIYGYTSNGSDFPHMKRGNRLYFSRKAVLKWIAEGRRSTHSEIEAVAASR